MEDKPLVETIQAPISGTIRYAPDSCCSDGRVIIENDTSVYVIKFQRDFCGFEESCTSCMLCMIPWCVYLCTDHICFYCYHGTRSACCGKKQHQRQFTTFDCCGAIESTAPIQNGLAVHLKGSSLIYSHKICNIVMPTEPAAQTMT